MPKTFGQTITSIKNQAIMQFQPILNKLTEIGNSDAFNRVLTGAINAMSMLVTVVGGVFEVVGGVAQFAVDNIGFLTIAIVAATTAWVAYKVAVGLATVAKVIATAVTWLFTSATLAQAGAQHGLNKAMYACPLVWIIGLIIIIIAAFYGVVAIINKFAKTSISATGVIIGAFAVLGAFIWNVIIGTMNAILQFLWTRFVVPVISIVEFILNVCNGGFNSFGDAVKNLLGNIISWFLSLGQVVTKIIDAIFGTNWTAGLESIKNSVLAWGKNENAITLSREAPVIGNRIEYGSAWNAGNGLGERIDNMFAGGEDPSADYGPYKINVHEPYAMDGMQGLDAISGGVGNIDANTRAQLDYSEEELKLWRDIAERDTVNHFTTAEVSVQFGDVNNNVNSQMDLDGIVEYLGEHIEEKLFEVAEGVYA